MSEDTSKYGSQLEDHPNWKGGRTVTSHGYVLVKAPDHPDSDTRGYIYEHRLVAEQKLGRRLESDEHVHHIDGDTQNNDPENLRVHHETEHLALEHSNPDRRKPGEENPVIECACGCGETFKKYDEWGRPRERVSGHTEYSLATPAKDDIVETLTQHGPMHRSDLAESVGNSLSNVSTHLSELRKDGKVEPVGGGDWDIVRDDVRTDGGRRRGEDQRAPLSDLVSDEWTTVIEREDRGSDRVWEDEES